MDEEEKVDEHDSGAGKDHGIDEGKEDSGITLDSSPCADESFHSLDNSSPLSQSASTTDTADNKNSKVEVNLGSGDFVGTSFGDVIDAQNASMSENCEVMSVDGSSNSVDAAISSPSRCKRLPSNDTDSPSAKRQTPDRVSIEELSPEKLPEVTSSQEVTSSLTDEHEPSSEGAAPTVECPSLNSEDDGLGGSTFRRHKRSSQPLDSHDDSLNSEDDGLGGSTFRRHKRSSQPLDSDDDSDPAEDDAPSNARRRMRNFRRTLGSVLNSNSSSSSSTNHSDNASDNNSDSDNIDAVDAGDDADVSSEEVTRAVSNVLDKPSPRPNFYLFPELRRREYGVSRRESVVSFNTKLQGSLELVSKMHVVNEMKYHEGCVNTLSFNRIGTMLASGSDDLNIALWNWQSRKPVCYYESGHRSNVFQAKFMPFSGDCHLVSCARDGQVRMAELSPAGVCIRTKKLANHRGTAHKLAIEKDSANQFLSCGEDAVTFLVDLREEKPHRLVTTKENDKKVPLYSIASNPADSRQFCLGGRDHFVRVYDKRKISEDVNGGVLSKLCPDHLIDSDVKANVTCAVYSYNGGEILATYNDEDIYLFDATMSDGANFIHRYSGHRNNATVKGVNFYGPKSEFIVSGSDCGNVYFWDKESEAIVNFQPGDDAGVVNVLEPHPFLPMLTTAGLDHEIKLWSPSPECKGIDKESLTVTIRRNHIERVKEKVAGPDMIGGQMLWFLMHHFRNSARRRMREEGIDVSSSDSDVAENSDEEEANNEMQCAQS